MPQGGTEPGRHVLLALALVGCDVIQGYRTAGNTLFPDEMNYLARPGLRLVQGSYRELELVAGRELYLLARSTEKSDFSLYVMRYSNPEPCAIRQVARYRPSRRPFTGPLVIAYLEEDTSYGTVRFADSECRPYPMTLAESGLPVADLRDGLVVPSPSGIWLINPATNHTELLLRSAESVTRNAFGRFTVVETMGRLAALVDDWKQAAWFGEQVKASGKAGESFFFEDSRGIHRLRASPGDPSEVEHTLIAPGGCQLGLPPDVGDVHAWVTYYEPCGEQELIAYDEASQQAARLGTDLDPRTVAVFPLREQDGSDRLPESFLIFQLADTDPDTGLGTLLLYTPDQQQYLLGRRAALERVAVRASRDRVEGYALVDVEGDVGRYLEWKLDGSTRVLAEQAWRPSRDLVLDCDGSFGRFALPDPEGIVVLAERVPVWRFKFEDPKQRWSAILHESDGKLATLSVASGSLDLLELVRTGRPVPALETIATGVRVDYSARFLHALPAVAYRTGYDPLSDTGRLEYHNLELGFSSWVHDGVGDYISTDEGVVYSVPRGEDAGIWLVRAH